MFYVGEMFLQYEEELDEENQINKFETCIGDFKMKDYVMVTIF